MRRRRRRTTRIPGRVLLLLVIVCVCGSFLSTRSINEPNGTRIVSATETMQETQADAGLKVQQENEKNDYHLIGAIVICVCCICIIVSISVIVYSNAYFRGKEFRSIKREIRSYIKDCNDLNEHIEDLKSTFVNAQKKDLGEASFKNVSRYKYKKKGIRDAKYAPNVYDCSRTVCDSARKQPFKYICKYFNIPISEETYEEFEAVLNNFLAAEEGKKLLQNWKNEILASITSDVPGLIRKWFGKKLERELGFQEYDFDELYFPEFSFRYISAGGNSGTQYDVVFDIPMLQRFVTFLGETVKFKKSSEGQRRLMTAKLRKFIIERDNHTCQRCGNSTEYEPNLLLEVDHIIPVSKGGITTEDNLQTLCWKCNRHKGAKLLVE